MFWIGFVGHDHENQHTRLIRLVCGEERDVSPAGDRYLLESGYVRQWITQLSRLVRGETDRVALLTNATPGGAEAMSDTEFYGLYRWGAESVAVFHQLGWAPGVQEVDAHSLPGWRRQTTIAEIRDYLETIEVHGMALATTAGLTSPHRPLTMQRESKAWFLRSRNPRRRAFHRARYGWMAPIKRVAQAINVTHVS